MPPRALATVALAAGVLTAAAVGGCGSDGKTDPAASGPKLPLVTTAAPTTSTAATAPTTTPAVPGGTPTTSTGPGSGGTPSGSGGSGSGGTPAAPGPGGSSGNPSSGAESNYQRYCASHPGACGD